MSTVTTIVDTSHTDQHALDRAFRLAKYQNATLHLHGMSYGYCGKSAADGNEQLLVDSKLTEIKNQAAKQGINTTTSKSYGNLWEVAFLSILKNQEHPTVVTSYPDRHLWRKWMPSKVINKFIFDFPCDVIMVKEHDHWVSNKALILLGPELSPVNRSDDAGIMNVLAQAANCGKELESFGLEVYYVCAYPDSHQFEGWDKLQEISSAPGSHMIFRKGQPETVVPPLVEELNADLLAVDVIKATAMGHQEGKYIHQLGQHVHCDIMASH